MVKDKDKKKGKQGLASWLTSVIALGIGLGNVGARAIESGGDWKAFIDYMVQDYGGYANGTFAIENAARGYIPIVAAVVFKKGSSELIKRCPVQSMIPKLG